MFLSGDRNLANGTLLQNGVLVITPARPVGWTLTIHKGRGSIALADDSVRQLSSARLAVTPSPSGETYRLAMP